MSFRLVNQGGGISEPVFLNVSASGTINPGTAVEWVPNITTGNLIAPATGVNSTQTALFGVAMSYTQGASDAYASVVPFTSTQIWDCDCANSVTTAQIGVRQYLSANKGFIHNQATDTSGINRVFLPIAIVGPTTGSGRLLGRFLVNPGASGL